MLLYDFLKPCVVQLGKFCQVVDIGDYVAQVFFQQQKVFIRWGTICNASGQSIHRRSTTGVAIQSPNDIVDFPLTSSYSPDYLSRFNSLKGKDFIKLSLELCNKGFLIVFSPLPPLGFWVFWGRLGYIWGFEGTLQVIV